MPITGIDLNISENIFEKTISLWTVVYQLVYRYVLTFFRPVRGRGGGNALVMTVAFYPVRSWNDS